MSDQSHPLITQKAREIAQEVDCNPSALAMLVCPLTVTAKNDRHAEIVNVVAQAWQRELLVAYIRARLQMYTR
jgi:hypothetical protein